MPERERFSLPDGGGDGRSGRFGGTATAERAPGGGGARRRFTVDALFADTRPQAIGVTDLPDAKEIQLDRIVPDPAQPRRTFDEEKLQELAASIAAEGVLQPIVVRYEPDADTYVIVHGERRWRASGLAARPAIPAIVRDVPAERRLLHQLIENIVRDDLNAVDRAAALRALKAQLGDPPWDQVAEAVGIRRSRLFQLLGTEKLPATAREDIRAGRLSEKQSRALQGLPPVRQEALRAWIVAHNLGTAEAIALARRLKAVPPAKTEDAAAAHALLAALAAGDHPASGEIGDGTVLLLLGAVQAAAHGGAGTQRRLRELAAQAEVPRFSEERLHDGIADLARTLARATRADILSPGLARELAALRDALDALLTEPRATPSTRSDHTTRAP